MYVVRTCIHDRALIDSHTLAVVHFQYRCAHTHKHTLCSKFSTVTRWGYLKFKCPFLVWVLLFFLCVLLFYTCGCGKKKKDSRFMCYMRRISLFFFFVLHSCAYVCAGLPLDTNVSVYSNNNNNIVYIIII